MKGFDFLSEEECLLRFQSDILTLNYFHCICVCVRVCVCKCHRPHVEVRGQFEGAGSLYPPYGFQD